MKARVFMALLFSLVIGSAATAQKKADPLVQEWQKLNQAYSKAMDDYYKPYREAKTEEEVQKIKLDPKKEPSKLYMPKFVSFAKKAGKSNQACEAWLMVFDIAPQSNDLKSRDLAVQMLLKDHIQNPSMERWVAMLQYSFYEMTDKAKRNAKILAVLNEVQAKSKSASVQAAALFSKAKVAENPQFLHTLIQKYPRSKAAESAKGEIFEMENLVVGKVAPDFTAIDQDGKEFRLSDYRGKITVLDFWGFW